MTESPAIPPPIKPADDRVRSRGAMANEINAKFGCQVTSQTLKYWGEHESPPFPAGIAHSNTITFGRAECFAWMEAFIARGGLKKKTNKDAEKAQGAKNRMALLDEKRAQFQFDLDYTQKYIERKTAQATINSALQKFRDFTREQLEMRIPEKLREKCKELGLTEGLTAAIYEYAIALEREAFDRIEEKCEREGK